MVRHAATGKYRRTRLFVLTLGYSRKSVRLLAWKSGTQEWAELHEQAFRRLGGTRLTVLDNLKEGVLTPDIYDPTPNPLYRDVLAHYGVVAGRISWVPGGRLRWCLLVHGPRSWPPVPPPRDPPGPKPRVRPPRPKDRLGGRDGGTSHPRREVPAQDGARG
jgi:hypothetical protein